MPLAISRVSYGMHMPQLHHKNDRVKKLAVVLLDVILIGYFCFAHSLSLSCSWNSKSEDNLTDILFAIHNSKWRGISSQGKDFLKSGICFHDIWVLPSLLQGSWYLLFCVSHGLTQKEWQVYYKFKYCLSICRLFSENNTIIHRLALHLVKLPLCYTPILNQVWDPAMVCIICYLVTTNLHSFMLILIIY